MTSREAILDPEQAIIDPHHHLWFMPQTVVAAMDLSGDPAVAALGRIYARYPSYMFGDLLSDVGAGHNIIATVFIEISAMYRPDGPAHLRSVGEIEFANGVAAMGASGAFGRTRACAAIIGAVDPRLGVLARETMEAHVAAGNGRYRGFRSHGVAHDPLLPDLNRVLRSMPGLLGDVKFRDGLRHACDLGLVYEAFQLAPQLDELLALARALPDLRIILNHAGMPIAFGADAHEDDGGRFDSWRSSIQALAACPNVVIKLGGLGNPLCGMRISRLGRAATSREMADEWRPYLETCIHAFGVERCMFESNAPVDCVSAPYEVIWNAFKVLTRSASPDERDALFWQTAARTYGIEVQPTWTAS